MSPYILIHLADLIVGVVSGVGKGIIGKYPSRKEKKRRNYMYTNTIAETYLSCQKHPVPAYFSKPRV